MAFIAKCGPNTFPQKAPAAISSHHSLIPFANAHVTKQKGREGERIPFLLHQKEESKGDGTTPITSSLLNEEGKQSSKRERDERGKIMVLQPETENRWSKSSKTIPMKEKLPWKQSSRKRQENFEVESRY